MLSFKNTGNVRTLVLRKTFTHVWSKYIVRNVESDVKVATKTAFSQYANSKRIIGIRYRKISQSNHREAISHDGCDGSHSLPVGGLTRAVNN